MLVSSHVKTVLAWLVYTNVGDVENMRKILSDNFLDQIRPLSLGVPDLTIEPFLARMAANKIKFGIAEPTPDNIIEANNVVTIWTNSNGTTEHGFDWKNEYVIRFKFENDKIVNVYEWVDPTVVLAAFAKEDVVAEAQQYC
ncbi:hypothetical protein D9615_008520 [Tricholomella constricta]|uniref:SnoaL-like domain-containing protein n=1 Tax=Tricholomella constricta TaxID=117010 RepID=A0A8H5H3X6_9AGAR|nr:hypothetical protein D9615_008520 [Tricholomella constricta]